MDNPNSKRSAFPPLPSYTEDERGLTKREYASIMAMQGMLSDYSLPLSQNTVNDICESSVRIADGLLKELEKNNG